MARRECEVCGTDLDRIGKRADATVCGSSCRAEKSRRRKAGEPLRDAARARRPRPRRERAGVEVYVPADEIQIVMKYRDSASPVLRKLAERTERAARRKR